MRVAHLTTTDISLRYLVMPQLLAVMERGGAAVGISGSGPFVPELTDAGIAHVDLASSTRSANLVADLKAAKELWTTLRRERPDILHTHNPKPGIYGRIIGRLTGVPIVVNTVHGLYASPEDRWTKRLFVYVVEAIASRFSDAELIQNVEDLELMSRLRIINPKKIELLGNGIDLQRFQPSLMSVEERAEARRSLGFEPDTVVVGIVGRLVAEKGIPELIEAGRLLGPGYSILAIGPSDPEKSDALSEEAVDEAERSGARFLGMRSDVEHLYPLMDVFALPSHREGFPRAAMEAAASGLPLVVTDIRGCRQVVDDGVNGYLVPLRDPTALADKIGQLGEDPELRAQMGRESRKKAERDFDENEVVRKVMDTYDRLVEQKLKKGR